jgi:hypothetical protein
MLFVPEQRLTPRFKLKIPFLFSLMNSPLDCGHAATTLNISRRGIFFATEHPLIVGLPVRLLLRMPGECSGTPAMRIVMTGRVSRVAAKWRGHGGFGVGVEFFYSEPFDRGV